VMGEVMRADDPAAVVAAFRDALAGTATADPTRVRSGVGS